MQINLNSPIFLTQSLIPLLQKSEGTILFTLENMKTIEKAYWGAYGTTKAALKHFVKSLKEELEDSHVNVHTITPKPMKTQLRAKGWPAEEGLHLVRPEEVVKEYLNKI